MSSREERLRSGEEQETILIRNHLVNKWAADQLFRRVFVGESEIGVERVEFVGDIKDEVGLIRVKFEGHMKAPRSVQRELIRKSQDK